MTRRQASLGRLLVLVLMFAAAAALVGLFAWDLCGAAGAALGTLVVGVVMLLAWGGE